MKQAPISVPLASTRNNWKDIKLTEKFRRQQIKRIQSRKITQDNNDLGSFWTLHLKKPSTKKKKQQKSSRYTRQRESANRFRALCQYENLIRSSFSLSSFIIITLLSLPSFHLDDQHCTSIMSSSVEPMDQDEPVQQTPNESRRGSRGGKPKLFQCTGYGDCRMVFTRSEHLARHMRYIYTWIDFWKGEIEC